MRNLKKILSLALALMMILSVTASAAFTDAAKIDADYADAVAVLNGMEVFQGYEDGSFQPTKAITRAEVAAIIYRIDTKDVEDEDVALYVGSANFSDVKAADWFSGYVGYCANAGYIKGYPDGTFLPNKTVTGFEALAMILRAMGYDAENEFSGAQWSNNIAKIATKAGILNVVKPGQLSLAGNREMIAQLLFDAIQAKTVKFYPAWGYLENATKLGDIFALTKVPSTLDAWGRPGYGYTYNTGDEETFFTYAPKAEYNVAVTECDLASALGLSKTTDVVTYTNGKGNVGADTINPIATSAKLGAQGRQMKVYKVGSAYSIVYIDTYLAKVASVSAAAFDAAGHLKTSSKMVLNVWTGDSYETVTLYGGKDNYTYASGDMVLVNAVDAANGAIATELGTYGTTATKLDVLGLATSMVGAQTILWWNVAQHTVNGTNYNDACTFFFDEADTDIGNHAWYFDQFGNLIGAADISTQYTYGVISNLWWAQDSSTGSGVAKATITYMDGSTAVVNLAKVDYDGVDGTDDAYVYTPIHHGSIYYNSPNADVMVCRNNLMFVDQSAYNNLHSGANSILGIIGGHMFQFVTLADGSVVAYRVTNELTAATVKKGYSLIDGTGTDIYTNSDTVYLVKNSNGTYTSVTGFNNIGNYTAATVDSVNTDADIYADYVFFYGTSTDATSFAFVMATGNNYGATLKTTTDGISYYEFTYGLNMDGTTSVLKVWASDYANVITKMANGVGKLFEISYTNGYATLATEVGTSEAGSGSYKALYLGTDVTVNADALYDTSAGKAYNVTASTVVIGGTLADLATPGASVYVVYKNGNDVNYVYITGFAKNTVAEAAAVLDAAHDYGTITLPEGATDAQAEAAVLAVINSKLASAGVTGVVATLNAGYPVTAVAGQQWFQIELADALGGTASVGANYATIAIGLTNATVAAQIQDACGSSANTTAYTSWTALKDAVIAKAKTVDGVTACTIDFTPAHYAAGDVLVIPYTATYNTAAVTGTVVITLF